MTVHSGDRCGTDEFLDFIGGGGGETTQVVQLIIFRSGRTIVDFLEFIRTEVVLWGSTSEQSPCIRPLAPLSFIF